MKQQQQQEHQYHQIMITVLRRVHLWFVVGKEDFWLAQEVVWDHGWPFLVWQTNESYSCRLGLLENQLH